MGYELSEESKAQAKRMKEARVGLKLHAMWKCGKCGAEFGELTEHPQAANQCPACLAGIQGLAAGTAETIAEALPVEGAGEQGAKIEQEVEKLLGEEPAIVEDKGKKVFANIEPSGEVSSVFTEEAPADPLGLGSDKTED